MSKIDIAKELEAIELDTGDDDYFEKALEITDDDMPKDDETGTGTSDKKVVDDPKDKEEPEETVEDLKAKIATLEKEAKGRLGDVVKSRQEKAVMKSELAELKTAVSDILAKREGTLETEPEKKVPLEDTKKAIEFADDDSAFVDLTEVKDAIKSETEQTKRELDALKNERAIEQAKKQYDANVNEIIGEDTGAFAPAYDNLKTIYQDLNQSIIDLQTRTGQMGEDGTIEQDIALDLFSGSPEEKTLLEKHPGIDPTRIARAFNSKVDFRTSLRHIADLSSKDAEPKLDDKIKAAQKKPSSLAGQENQAAGTVDLITRLADLDHSEIEEMSDSEVAKIEAMLEREALKGD